VLGARRAGCSIQSAGIARSFAQARSAAIFSAITTEIGLERLNSRVT
jgi:hypothetical protein